MCVSIEVRVHILSEFGLLYLGSRCKTFLRGHVSKDLSFSLVDYSSGC